MKRRRDPRRLARASLAAWCAPALVMAAVTGCGPRMPHPWREASRRMVWPPAPNPPRVVLEGVMASGELRRFRTGIRALLDALLGAPQIEIRTPHGIAADGDTLVIADSSAGAVHVLDLRRRRYRRINSIGRARLRCPIGVALDGAGGMFLSDSALRRVVHLSLRGEVLGEVPGTFIRPTGLAYEPGRRLLHVVDTALHAVHTFRVEGSAFTLLRTLGARGEQAGLFNFPTHLAVGRDAALYVVDSLNYRVQMFGPEGDYAGGFGRAGDGTGDFGKAKGIALDSRGHIYLVDSLFDVVQVFDRTGRLLLWFGGSGRGEGALWLPTGICIDAEDRIYVGDSGNSRIEVYRYVEPQG